MAKKKPPEEVDDSDLLSDSQFDLESDPGLHQKRGGKPVVFLIISLVFAAGVAVFALYSLELGPFAAPPAVETTQAAPEKPASVPAAPPPATATGVTATTGATAPTALPPPPTPAAAAAEEKEEPPAKGKKGKAKKEKKSKKKKKKK